MIQSFRPTIGGAELQLERVLPHLQARGVSVTVLTRGVRGARRRERLAGAEIRRGLVGGRSALASAAYTLGSLAHVALRRGRYDLLHAHGTLSEGTVVLGAGLLGVPALVTVLLAGPEGDFEVLKRRPAGKWRLRALVGSAWFATLSAALRAQLEELGVPPQRIFAVPNGVDVATYRPASAEDRARLRERFALPQDALIVAFVGRLVPRKRVATAIGAVARATTPIWLVVVGDGPQRAELECTAAELGVGQRVRFAGAAANVADYLRAADVFVLPSREEGLSNALLEAMACGLPCVAGPVSGVEELFADGRGLVVSSEEAEDWAKVLERLVRDEEHRRRLGASAAELIQADLTLERTADRLVEAYRTIVAASSQS